MGHLTYAGSTEYQIEDRMLAHLKIAVATKLRRQEPFLVSWDLGRQAGSGRVSLWMAPSIPLEFRFSGSRQPQLNAAWLEAMVEMANSSRGLVLIEESDAVRLVASQGGGQSVVGQSAVGQSAHAGS